MTTATDDTRRVLDLLSQGKITVEEADQLLRAMKEGAAAKAPPASAGDPARPAPRWVRISIDNAAHDDRPAKNVTIRVPIALARGGVRLGAMFPYMFGPKLQDEFRRQGVSVDWSKIDLSQVETMLNDFGETTIDVDNGKKKVTIRCE